MPLASLAIALAITTGTAPDSPMVSAADRHRVCGMYENRGHVEWDTVSTESALAWQATAASLARMGKRSINQAELELGAWCATAAVLGRNLAPK